jgi:hypothetical protein
LVVGVPPLKFKMPTEIFDAAAERTVDRHATAAEEESHGDEDRSMASATDEDDSLKEFATPSRGCDEETASKADTGTPSSVGDMAERPSKKKKPPTPRKGRSPAVKGLSIPFRTVKKVSRLGGGMGRKVLL